MGRFLSMDPAAGDPRTPVTLHRYLYAGADPVNHQDPSGRDFTIAGNLAASSIGSTLNQSLGTAGQFVFDSVEKKSVAWESFRADLYFAGLGVLGLAIGGVTKLIAVPGTAIRDWQVPAWASRWFEGSIEVFEDVGKFKSRFGDSPGEGRIWHHIVEQNAQVGRRADFAAEQVQNTWNIVDVPQWLNQKLANYYNGRDRFTDGLRVRDWLADKSWAEQFEFGLNAISRIAQDNGVENIWDVVRWPR